MCIALYHKVNNFISTSVLPNVADEEAGLAQVANLTALRDKWLYIPPKGVVTNTSSF